MPFCSFCLFSIISEALTVAPNSLSVQEFSGSPMEKT